MNRDPRAGSILSTRIARGSSDPRHRTLAAGVALLLMAACAALPPKPLPLSAAVVGVRVARLTLFDTRMSFALLVHNPNPYDLSVAELQATLAVENDRLLTGSLAAPVNLAADADTPVEIETRTDYAALLAAIDRYARQGSVHYELKGSATLQSGLTLPFSRGGELPTADLYRGKQR